MSLSKNFESEELIEENRDINEFLEVETRDDSEEDVSVDKPLVCKICFAKFKTRSGWKNHKVIHQKFRTKEFACYVCFRRFYWDKDCRRHIKNIHGIDNYDAEESRAAANRNYSKCGHDGNQNEHNIDLLKNIEKPDDSDKTLDNFESDLVKTNFLKMKLEMVKCKKNRLINANKKKDLLSEADPFNSPLGHSKLSESNCNNDDINLNNNLQVFNSDLKMKYDSEEMKNSNSYSLRSIENETISNIVDNEAENSKVSENTGVEDKIIGVSNEGTETKDIPKMYKCQECMKKFLHIKSLKSHQRTCKAPLDSPYFCTLCDRRFLGFEQLTKHWKVNHRRQQMM